LPRYRALLERRELWDAAAEETLRAEVNASLSEAAHAAESAGEVPFEWMFDDVYATRPWHLDEQLAEAES